MPAFPNILDTSPMRQDAAAFRRQPDQHGILYTVQPARPALAFQSAALLLAGLFAAPALGVLLDPSRHDGISLLAATVGLGVAGLAMLALLRARRHRRARQFRLRAEGLEWEGALLHWQPWNALRVTQPEAGPQARGATGIHGLAARVAAQQHAAEVSVILEGMAGGPLPLASGLDLPTAHALREAMSRDMPPGVQPQ